MFAEYRKRFTICFLGLLLYGLGNYFSVMAGSVGTNAWNTLSIGLAGTLDIRFGQANFMISLVIIVIDLFGKGKLGFGTLMNIIAIPVFSDLFLSVFSFLPAPDGPLMGLSYALISQLIIAVAAVFYMKPALGYGPRDTFIVIIGRKLPKLPIGVVKYGIEIVALSLGLLMGAPFGIGTVITVTIQASLFQLACRLFRFEPRNVRNEDFIDTVKRIRSQA